MHREPRGSNTGVLAHKLDQSWVSGCSVTAARTGTAQCLKTARLRLLLQLCEQYRAQRVPLSQGTAALHGVKFVARQQQYCVKCGKDSLDLLLR